MPMFTPETGMLTTREFIRKIYDCDFEVVTSNKNNDPVEYYNIPAAFDIEVSSFYDCGEKRASMYVWQFGILNWVTYGRTWEEFDALMKVITAMLGLNSKRRLIIYVHNLSYEFQFIRKRFKWDKVFLLESRAPVYALTGGIEFRCSLKLSSKKLEKVGKDLQRYKVEKLVGDLDYKTLRLSTTELTEKELAYCENDIRVLLSYIQEKIEDDGSIVKIPLTNTGYVRNFCREKCFSNYKRYKNLMSLLTLDANEYKQLKRAFQGGFTHANANYSTKTMKNVASFDFTSSYPAVMVLEKFPMSKAELVESISSYSELQYYLKKYCCLFDITLHDVIPSNGFDHPISLSKCRNPIGVVTDNGRVVSASSITITCTEQDYFVYREFYSWSSYEIFNFRVYKKAYLPTAFVKAIIEIYKKKTTLKDVAGEEIQYMIFKNMLNSCFGMSVTDIVRDVIEYENGEYSTSKPDLATEIDKYNKSRKRFLFYPWGVWVTSYARANLFSGILAVGSDYIYSDTDSMKILNYESHMDYINRYNNGIMAKIEKSAKHHNIPVEDFSPKTIEGKTKTIGLWDFEGVYDSFKTIGAKRYLLTEGGKLKLTVAGLDKKGACKYLEQTFEEPYEAFNEHLKVPKESSGRLTVTYIDEETRGTIVDYNGVQGEYHELSSVHMEESDYELTMSPEYKRFLDFIYGKEDISW